MNAYEILGQQMVNEAIGADPAKPGFDAQFGINAAAELLSRGVNTYDQKKAAEKLSADVKAAGDKAIAADIAWANAEMLLAGANATRDPQKILAAQTLADNAQRNALSAGSNLPPEAMTRRIESDNKAVQNAADASLKNSSNAAQAAALAAWQKVAAAAAAQVAQQPGGQTALELARQHGGGSFLDALKKKYGPLPLWGWGLGTIGVGTGLTLLIRSLRKRK